MEGPFLHHLTKLSTDVDSPSQKMSTVPSHSFLTQPDTPIRVAACMVEYLNPTPCTLPCTFIFKDLVSKFRPFRTGRHPGFALQTLGGDPYSVSRI